MKKMTFLKLQTPDSSLISWNKNFSLHLSPEKINLDRIDSTSTDLCWANSQLDLILEDLVILWTNLRSSTLSDTTLLRGSTKTPPLPGSNPTTRTKWLELLRATSCRSETPTRPNAWTASLRMKVSWLTIRVDDQRDRRRFLESRF